MKEIRWGIIGCGKVTEVKSGPGLQQAEGSRLVAVMRRNGELAEDYARRHNVPKWYDDADALINDDEVDAVYIATPPAYHKEYTIAAAKAKKPVYVEKPMALNFEECQEMIEACNATSTPLFVAYYRRALPRFLKIKKLLDDKAIGNVKFVSTVQYRKPSTVDLAELSWRTDPKIAGGGYFFDVGSHTLDIIDYLLGPIKEVSGHASNQAGLYPAEDIVTGSYVFESGVHGSGIWCFTAHNGQEMNEIIGDKGKMSFSTYGTEPVRVLIDGEETFYPIDNPVHIQQPLIQTVVNELLGKGTCPSTGISAARTSWVLDKMVGKI
ncbi:MAG: Gfo/Idh/MocA family oxidoreductase [Clostridiales bacterium]|nr:Gfo/Idh/MocA family oxidoreductase [Clostridiales bacterium]